VHLFSVRAGFGYVGALSRGSARAQRKLERPSGLAWVAVGRRLLVAESGGMRIAVFRIEGVELDAHAAARADIESQRTLGGLVACFGHRSGTHRSVHLCDIAVEQLGTGLHKPQAGVWSWLACDAAPEGDVYVADCDNACVHVI
jgi:hypothetical protein